MKDSFLKIAKAAKKESHTGYGDYAVFGGFSAFVEKTLSGDDSDDALLLKGVCRHYGDSNLITRKSIIALTLKILGDIETEEAANAPAASEEAPAEALFSAEPPPERAAAEDAPEEGSAAPKGEERRAPGKAPAVPKRSLKSAAASRRRGDIPTELSYLKGVGPKKAELLNKLGIRTVYDLCEYFPHRHEDRRFITPVAELNDGEQALVSGVVDRVELNRVRSRLQILKARLSDETGSLTVVWFNQPWLKQQLYDGREITVYGKAEFRGQRPSMTVSEYELARREEGFGILPVYGLTAGINQKTMRRVVASALELCGGELAEFFPADFLAEHRLEPRPDAVFDFHFPPDFESLRESRRRLVFEEFFLFRLAFRRRHDNESKEGVAMARGSKEEFFGMLPFTPTGAQDRAVSDIFRDMASPRMMNRLLEGDVGSGKTMVAAAAVWRCWRSGHQSALMAPTEILAEQHYASMRSLFADVGLNIALLTGSTKAAEKRSICRDLDDGKIDLLIGTHALIESTAVFRDLALVVIDEQHRFGVNQRGALFMKGNRPDLLVMTATPIPRTLAMTVFSGLDLSILDEMPPGRKPIKTMVITNDQEDRAIRFMKRHVEAGHQCYVVCPLVEESEKLDVEAATRFYDRLRLTEMNGVSVGLLHGKMKAGEKEDILNRFRDNEISVLVATTVIEVGIDVPNATVMYVKDADRFGLAQLHQIRGRIGRGRAAGTCLLQSGGKNELAMERLRVLERCGDGFKVAEEDLKLRGPGDFFGVRQHGLPEMNLADLFRDHELLREAAAAVDALLADDPELADAKWRPALERAVRQYDTIQN